MYGNYLEEILHAIGPVQRNKFVIAYEPQFNITF